MHKLGSLDYIARLFALAMLWDGYCGPMDPEARQSVTTFARSVYGISKATVDRAIKIGAFEPSALPVNPAHTICPETSFADLFAPTFIASET